VVSARNVIAPTKKTTDAAIPNKGQAAKEDNDSKLCKTSFGACPTKCPASSIAESIAHIDPQARHPATDMWPSRMGGTYHESVLKTFRVVEPKQTGDQCSREEPCK
jgi:hypothetical protein